MAVFPYLDLELSILKNQHFAKSLSGAIYHYEDGVYKPDGDDYIARQIKVILKQRKQLSTWTIAGRERVLASIKDELPTLTTPDTQIINLKNGLLDIDKNKLLPHTPNHLSPIQIPIAFDPNAVCPAWDEFLSGSDRAQGVFPGETGALVYELIGYLLAPDVSREKAFFLIGPPGTGKSTFLEAIRKVILGEDNVSSQSLNAIVADKFVVASLEGKLANLCGDIPGKRSKDVSIFNSIVSGEGIPAQKKFDHPFSLIPSTRLLFSSNEVPSPEGGAAGWFRRILAIPFNTSFTGNLDRKIIIAKLGTPGERSGLLNKALTGYRTVRKNGEFTMSESIIVFNKEFQTVSDEFEMWLNDTMQPTGTISKASLLEIYNRMHGNKPLTEELFARRLKQRRPELDTARLGSRDDRANHWVGLSLKIDL